METEASLETITSVLYKGVVPRCDKCGQSFPSVGAMDTHMKQCKNEISTANNSKSSVVKTDMDSNSAELYNNVTPTCDDCSQPNRQVCFPSVGALNKHMEENHLVSLIKSYTDIHAPVKMEDEVKNEPISQKLYCGQIPTCDICNQTFMNVGTLHLHVKSDHVRSNDFSSCKNESESSWLTSDILEELHEDKGENVALTPEVNVDRISGGEPGGKENKLMHACSQCGKIYGSIKSLANHMVSHTDKYRCHKCEYNFESPSTLKMHKCEAVLRRKAREAIQAFECDECGDKFSNSDNLKRHKITHTSRFQCNLCHAGFYSVKYLQDHKNSKGSCQLLKISRENRKRRSMLLKESKFVSETTSSKENQVFNQSILNSETNIKSDEMGQAEVDSEFSDFSLLRCETCDKYFVSHESLSAHKAHCTLLDVKTELPFPQIENNITELQQNYPGISFVPKVQSL